MASRSGPARLTTPAHVASGSRQTLMLLGPFKDGRLSWNILKHHKSCAEKWAVAHSMSRPTALLCNYKLTEDWQPWDGKVPDEALPQSLML